MMFFVICGTHVCVERRMGRGNNPSVNYVDSSLYTREPV